MKEAGAFAVVFVFYLLFWGLPGLLFAGIGWWLSRRLKNIWVRASIRAGLVSFALAPTFYGHAGVVPAILAMFFPPVAGTTDWVAIATLLLGWCVAFGIILRIEWPGPKP